VWRQITFILTASAFFLVGIELPETVRELPAEELRLLPLLVLAVVAVLLVTRMLFVLGYSVVVRQGEGRIGWREAVVVGWAGARGPVSGLAAFSIPMGVGVEATVDQSVLLQATTFVVVAITLALSPTLALVARLVRLGSDDLAEDQRAVRIALATRGLDALDDAARDAAERRQAIPAGAEEALRQRLTAELSDAEGAPEAAASLAEAHVLEEEVLQAQQDELLRLREAGTPDAVIRPAMHEIDLQLGALRSRRPGESG
jgi:CPA1 family monovalent cation:H+ antiporter